MILNLSNERIKVLKNYYVTPVMPPEKDLREETVLNLTDYTVHVKNHLRVTGKIYAKKKAVFVVTDREIFTIQRKDITLIKKVSTYAMRTPLL